MGTISTCSRALVTWRRGAKKFKVKGMELGTSSIRSKVMTLGQSGKEVKSDGTTLVECNRSKLM